MYSEYLRTFDQASSSTASASIFVRGGMINSKVFALLAISIQGVQEQKPDSEPSVYILGKMDQPEEKKVDPKPTPQVPLKVSFTKFVPTQTKAETKKSPGADLASMFGPHSDEEEEEEKKKKKNEEEDKTIKVNRRTNIHYAGHRNGEK